MNSFSDCKHPKCGLRQDLPTVRVTWCPGNLPCKRCFSKAMLISSSRYLVMRCLGNSHRVKNRQEGFSRMSVDFSYNNELLINYNMLIYMKLINMA